MLARLQETVRHSAIYTLPSIASQVIGIILVPIYTRIFVPADYGIMAGISLAIPITTWLLMCGIESAVARHYMDSQDEQDKKVTAATGLYFVAILSFSVVGISVLFFSKEISQLVLDDPQYSTYFVVALAAIPFQLCYKLALDILRFRFRVNLRTILSIAHMLVNIGLTIYFVVFLRIGILGVYLATLITGVTFCVAVLLMVWRNYGRVFSFQRLKQMLAYGIPLVPTSMVAYIYQYADRYLLIRLANLEAVGLYSVGMTIASAITLIMGGFQSAWVPIMLSTFRDEGSKEFYARVFNYYWALVLFAAVGISLLSKEVITILAPATYLDASKVVPFLLLSILFYNGLTAFSFGISIAKKTKYRLMLMTVTAAINIGLNYLLIPGYGMVGAAIATLISSVIHGIASFIVSQRLYHVTYDLATFFKILMVAVAIMFTSYFLFSDVNLQNILIKVGLIGVFMACLYFFKLIGREELIYLKKLAYRVLLRRRDITQF